MSNKQKRGFACMTPERRKEIAAMGGKAVPSASRSFSKSRDLAAAAGKIGGVSIRPESRSFSQDRDLAARAGAKGGHASHRVKAAARAKAAQ